MARWYLPVSFYIIVFCPNSEQRLKHHCCECPNDNRHFLFQYSFDFSNRGLGDLKGWLVLYIIYIMYWANHKELLHVQNEFYTKESPAGETLKDNVN